MSYAVRSGAAWLPAIPRVRFAGLWVPPRAGGPVGATPWDDEFDVGGVIDTAGARFAGAVPWTAFNPGAGALSSSITGGVLTLTSTTTDAQSMNPRGYYQPLPAGDWRYRTRVHGDAGSNFEAVGLMLWESGTNKALSLGIGYDQGAKVQVRKFAVGGAWASNPFSTAAPSATAETWLEVERRGTSLRFRYSLDGAAWVHALTVAQTVDFTTAPDRVALFVNGHPHSGHFQWYRKDSMPAVLDIVNPGAESVIAAPWVSVVNTLSRRSGTQRSGTYSFCITSVGPFEVYQDIPIHEGYHDDVDAGEITMFFSGWGMAWTGATSSYAFTISALDDSDAVLASETSATIGPSASYSERTISLPLPAGTRTLRLTVAGTNTASQDCWFDDLSLMVG